MKVIEAHYEEERIIRSKIDGTYKNKPVEGFDEVMELERRIASQRGTIRVYNNKLKSRLEQVERLKQENKELREENAELTCQMKRNTFCYSCVNATDRCFRNEIGCPCENYSKANEWHYPSKGEYPKEGENVLCYCYCKGAEIKFCCVGHTVIGGDNKIRWWSSNRPEELEVYAWKEIVLPKEVKENEN